MVYLANNRINEAAWDNITEAEKLNTFIGFASAIEQGERDWKMWFMSSEPENTPLPGEWESKLNDIQKMIIVRSLRPDRIIFCCQNFVVNNLGQKFIEPPMLDVQDILQDSSPRIPLIFVLSPGVDPTVSLQQLAAKKNMSDRFCYVSLGQGQAPKATRLIEDGLRNGIYYII